MRKLIVGLGLSIMLTPPHSKAQYVPPDLFGDAYKTQIGFWPNEGQIIKTNGDPAPTVKFVSHGCSPQIFLHEKGRASYVLRDLDASMQDTLHRLDMKPAGE